MDNGLVVTDAAEPKPQEMVTDAMEPKPEEMDWKEGQTKRVLDTLPNVKVGPFFAAYVPDDVRGGTVGCDNIPVILYDARIKKVDGHTVHEEKYAVLMPPTKDPKKRIGIVCAGCYKPGMQLWDISRCVNCRTFVNHLDPVLMEHPHDKRKKIPVIDTDGFPVRKRKCASDNTEYSLAESIKRVKNGSVKGTGGLTIEEARIPVPKPVVNLADFSAQDLYKALQAKHDEDGLELEEALLFDVVTPTALLGRLASLHEDGIAGFFDHIPLDKMELYVKEKSTSTNRSQKKSAGLESASFEELEAAMRFKALGTDTTRAKFYGKVKVGKRGFTKTRTSKEPHFTDDPIVTWDYVSNAVHDRYRKSQSQL